MRLKLLLLCCFLATIPFCDAFSQKTYVYNGTTFYYHESYGEDYRYVNPYYDGDGDLTYYDYEYPNSINPYASLVPGSTKPSGNVVIPEKLPVSGYIYYTTPSAENHWRNYNNSASKNSYSYESPKISHNESTIARIYFATSGSITFTVVSNGESNYDYLTIGEMDSDCTRDKYKYTMKGKAGTTEKLTYSPNDSKLHYVEFCYSKDGSDDQGTDNATIYVSDIEKIEADVRYIRDETFSNCTGMKSLVIPGTVVKVGYSSYYEPKSVFNGCTNLTSVTLSDSDKPISIYGAQSTIFADCPLTDLYIGRSVQFSRNGYYDDPDDSDYSTGYSYAISPINKTITNVRIGEKAKSIDCIFNNNITNLYIKSIESWLTATHSFNGRTAPILTYEDLWNNVSFYGNQILQRTSNLYVNGELTTNLEIPDGRTSIPDFLFDGAKMLKTITIPEGVTSIGSYAFRNCSSLTSFTIPSSVTSIGIFAFEGCI